ncbi:hypothetical protein ACFWR9_20575 [Streptomyces sp. NPDC058534]|uniref:hypothetical protein n=1 Tax=Streptomyces sp. NPDC058534 TaxID=3346541 RepID=UPI0036600F76
MRRCDCCGELIEGEPRVYDIPAPSGAGATVYVHPEPCKASPPRQTYPVKRGR